MSTPEISVKFFGHFVLELDGDPLPECTAGKARNLLQYLILEHGRPVPSSALREALWQDDTTRSALRVAAHSLRRYLRKATGNDDVLTVETTPNGGYRLDVDKVDADCFAFKRELDLANASSDGAVASRHRRRAIALYREDLLRYEPDTPWVELRRYALRSSLLTALEVELAIALKRRRRNEVIGLATRILDIEPHTESAYRALIEYHGIQGHHQQVNHWYELCHKVLDRNLDSVPEPETHDAFHRAMAKRSA